MTTQPIVDTVLRFYPDVQAIYLFGSSGTEYARPDSDIDLALLLPPLLAKSEKTLTLNACWSALVNILDRSVDLVNLRQVNTVFQMQIVETGRVIFEADRNAIGEFEMLTLSYYQKLQEERADIIADIAQSKRILNV